MGSGFEDLGSGRQDIGSGREDTLTTTLLPDVGLTTTVIDGVIIDDGSAIGSGREHDRIDDVDLATTTG